MNEIFNQKSSKEKRRQLRSNPSKPETLLWGVLRCSQLKGYKFRRQHSIGPYIVDFYCPRAKLVIEVDGDSHYSEEAISYDQKRQTYIESLGIKVLRFTNIDVNESLDGVAEVIEEYLL